MAKEKVFCECEAPDIGRRLVDGRIKLRHGYVDPHYSRFWWKCRRCGRQREFLVDEQATSGGSQNVSGPPVVIRLGIPEKGNASPPFGNKHVMRSPDLEGLSADADYVVSLPQGVVVQASAGPVYERCQKLSQKQSEGLAMEPAVGRKIRGWLFVEVPVKDGKVYHYEGLWEFGPDLVPVEVLGDEPSSVAGDKPPESSAEGDAPERSVQSPAVEFDEIFEEPERLRV